MKKTIFIFIYISLLMACKKDRLKPIEPDIITDFTLNDTDDPAIWVNSKDVSKSIVFGTDKDSNGAVYAFDLNGKIIEEKTIRNIRRPNNVDVEYGFQLNDSTRTDILVFTEREKQQIRVFAIPEMRPLDNGGFAVFEDIGAFEENLPMGIALYKSPIDAKVYAIVSRKKGPKAGYLYQYELKTDSLRLQSKLVRKFGAFSGQKEIEAIAVDDEMGFIYYSDEGFCIRKYYAEPNMGNKEVSCFGGEEFLDDIEGIAIARYPDGKGYLLVSDQQQEAFNIFSRKENRFIKAVNLTTLQTDGCEVVTAPLNETFTNGLFVAMNDEKNFYFYNLKKIIDAP